MKYVLLIYLKENMPEQEPSENAVIGIRAARTTTRSNGRYLATAPLRPVATATSVVARWQVAHEPMDRLPNARMVVGSSDQCPSTRSVAIAAQIPELRSRHCRNPAPRN